MQTSTRRRFLRCGISSTFLGACWHLRSARATPQLDRGRWGPFLCQADFPLSDYESLFVELADLQRELSRTLAIGPPRAPIELFLFADQSAHREFVSERFPRVPYRQALFIKSEGIGRVFAFRHAEMATDVRHECTHALLHASHSMVPLWLDEGLAEYFELPAPQRAFDHPHLKSLRWNMRLGIFPALRSLEQKGELAEMGGVEYRFAWAWAHFMLHGPRAAHRELVSFLADIRRSVPPGRISDRLVRAIPDVERRLVAHFKYWRRK